MEFKTPLHVNAPNIGDRKRFYECTEAMFDSKWLTNDGELVRRFEQELQDYLGVRHCLVVSSGTAALQLAIQALELSGEVMLPSLTYVATAHALQWLGIKPVFCDIDPESLCIHPDEITRHITPRTTGIIGVHVYGRGCDTAALEVLAEHHQLKLIYDAAHAFGNAINGKPIGCFGDCEVFSFHATKFFNSFEGGAITTNNDDLAERIRLMRNFGFSDLDQVDCVGINGKMTEVCAAMGLTNLQSIDLFFETSRRNYETYMQGVAEIPGLRLIPCREDHGNRSNMHYIVMEVEEGFPLSRDALVECLHNENVMVRRYFWPGCHRMEPYRTLQPDVGNRLPVTEAFLERVLLFPNGTAVDPETIRRMLGLIQRWCG